MESGKNINNKERLMRHGDVKRLVDGISLADTGFFLLEVFSAEDAQQILAIVKNEVPKQTELPIDIVSYTPKTDPDYSRMDSDTITEKIGTPFRQWIDAIQIPQEDDAKKTRLFVIDGSAIDQKNRVALVDHFAFMNGPRDKIAGNKRGPVLVIIPAGLEIERDIGKYSDLMSCCSGRFHIEE